MERQHPGQGGKKLCCVLLAGSLLWSGGLPAYAAGPAGGSNSFAQTLRMAEPGEYFYTQLNENEKAVYDSILSQVEELAKDPLDLSGVQVVIPKDSGYSITGKPIFAVFRDHPEIFWVDSSKLVWAEGNPRQDGEGNDIFVLSCMSGESFFYPGFAPENLPQYRADLNAKVAEIKANVPATAVDTVAKLRYLNDWIALHNVYNDAGLSASNFSRCAASGLLSDNDVNTTDDDPVCYGYATAMKVLLDAFGIENAYIEGWAYNTNNRPNGEQHAWNYVKLDDGTGNTQWYALDPTWDDPQLSILPARQVYFLVGSSTETEKNFTGYETFGKNHDSSTAKSPAYTTWKLTYPALAQQARDPSADGNVLLQGADGSSRSYDTLEAAMNDAVSGDTLVLQNAVSLSNTLMLKDGVTLDLNGQTGGNASSPCAVTSTASPVFRVEAGGSATITNSMGFTTVKTSAASVTVVENNGTLNLGTNIQLSGGTTPMGSAAVISGNAPKLAPHTRYVAVSKFVTTYLVAQPQDPAPDSYQAQEGDTVQDLLNARPGPAVAMQYYGNMGNLINIPGTEYTLDWKLQQGPNGGQHQPTDPLENGSYVFEAQAYDYTISYEVEVSGLLTQAPRRSLRWLSPVWTRRWRDSRWTPG